MSESKAMSDPEAETPDVLEDLEISDKDAGEVVGGDGQVQYLEFKLKDATVSK